MSRGISILFTATLAFALFAYSAEADSAAENPVSLFTPSAPCWLTIFKDRRACLNGIRLAQDNPSTKTLSSEQAEELAKSTCLAKFQSKPSIESCEVGFRSAANVARMQHHWDTDRPGTKYGTSGDLLANLKRSLSSKDVPTAAQSSDSKKKPPFSLFSGLGVVDWKAGPLPPLNSKATAPF